MNALVTGGAGFIGRWVVSELLDRGYTVQASDDLSSGREATTTGCLAGPGTASG